MIDGLKPYPEYKSSGQPWLGRIPAHWHENRAKCFFREIDERSATGKEELLSVSHLSGITKRSETNATMFLAKTNVGHKMCRPGDIVINTMWAWMGALGVSRLTGLVSPSYGVYRPSSQAKLLPDFVHYLIRTQPYISEYTCRSTGIHTSRLRLYPEQFLRIPVLCPPIPEQESIIRFLNQASRKINRAIRVKKKLIGLLNEQKQAIIRLAVTRGVNPNVKFKESRIPWLGEIPAHWVVWRISRLARVGNGSTPSRSKPIYWKGGSYPWLTSSNVNRGFVDSADQFVTKTALRECHLPRVQPGSVLVAITGQGKTRGTAAMLGIEATINQHIAYVTPQQPLISPVFLHFVLTAAYQTLRALSSDSGSTKGALTCEDLKLFKVGLPALPEQSALIEYIHRETQIVDTAITATQRNIDLLCEYRTRLISDVVTGKLDVREAARHLPDEAEEPSTLEADNGDVELELELDDTAAEAEA
jgi:type I restriction enzyme S subunit